MHAMLRHTVYGLTRNTETFMKNHFKIIREERRCMWILILILILLHWQIF